MKNILSNPIVKVVLICLATIIIWPRVRPYAQKLPVVGAWL